MAEEFWVKNKPIRNTQMSFCCFFPVKDRFALKKITIIAELNLTFGKKKITQSIILNNIFLKYVKKK